jgi:hypothetical protein
MLERASSNRNRKVRIIKKRYGGHTKERDSYSGSPRYSVHEVKKKKKSLACILREKKSKNNITTFIYLFI